jgi:hypothetical protein
VKQAKQQNRSGINMQPTRKQFDIISKIYENGSIEKLDTDKDLDQYLILVNEGYLKKETCKNLMKDWIFTLTDRGKEYIT